MNVTTILVNSLWCAVFATCFGVILTTPARVLVSCFAAGFAGRFVRDVLMGYGMSQNWSTVVAAAALVLVATALARHHRVSPAALICGVLPLGSAVAMFHTLFELMKASSSQGELLEASTVALSANFAKAFTGTLAIALGLAAGMAIIRVFRRQDSVGV
jgi:uncharacterized membrane protein YjjB (DUF3815 family)